MLSAQSCGSSKNGNFFKCLKQAMEHFDIIIIIILFRLAWSFFLNFLNENLYLVHGGFTAVHLWFLARMPLCKPWRSALLSDVQIYFKNIRSGGCIVYPKCWVIHWCLIFLLLWILNYFVFNGTMAKGRWIVFQFVFFYNVFLIYVLSPTGGRR